MSKDILVKFDMDEDALKSMADLAALIDGELLELSLSNGEHMCLLVFLSLYWIKRGVEMSDGELTVENLANSLRESIVRSWKKTSERRGQ